jgi:molybdenum cofactor cytidylyltransferase
VRTERKSFADQPVRPVINPRRFKETMIPGLVNWGVVVLAAGQSARMGRPKLLLPWGDTSILGHQLRTWQQLRARQIAVVCAESDHALHRELDRLNFPAHNRILNSRPEMGMFSSIRCAALWPGRKTGLTHWAITLGDQPHLRFETLHTLLHFSARHPDKVCQPRRLDRLHHPVILPERFFRQLAETSAATLKDFLRTIPEEISGCEIDDAGLDFDIDTPADYERALKYLVVSRIANSAPQF